MYRSIKRPRIGLGGPSGLSDKSLVCRECGVEFLFTEGEQDFYQKRGLLNEPSRCPECRAARRRSRSSEDGAPRVMHAIVCASCGRDAEVPFQPRLGRPVYCSDCFTAERAVR
ncbi:MAG: zinc-ribbon domain containing protein [Chloroflexota bacterium]|nr:zinc-ribbon domain containing protein [Chloroflexota bacterium]MDE2942271.1 zinc-ribbon domain containing protein [Chloroflexota bacterium]MDE3266981.1 zinc-ribbon domain containing protein [Chloroflexota bacterium]